MNCPVIREQLSAFADGEVLTHAERAAVEQHLAGCPACTAELASLQSLIKAARQQAEYHKAPDLLRARLARLRHAPQASAAAPAHRNSWYHAPALRYAGTFAAGALVVLALRIGQPLTSGDSVADEAVASHVRSLMAEHLMDVASTDQHTVKPWFAGKLDFSPPVLDLATLGYPLVGGRLDYIGSHTAAALVYRRHQHVINVFVWPADHESAVQKDLTRNGYSVVKWQASGMNFCAVSDLNAAELSIFARALGER